MSVQFSLVTLLFTRLQTIGHTITFFSQGNYISDMDVK